MVAEPDVGAGELRVRRRGDRIADSAAEKARVMSEPIAAELIDEVAGRSLRCGYRVRRVETE